MSLAVSPVLEQNKQQDDANKGKKKIPNRYVPLKVEPKTYFANERTFIQWVSVAILILTMSTIVTSFGDMSATIAGIILMPISLFFLIYAIMQFHWRAIKIRTGNAGAGVWMSGGASGGAR